MKIWFRANFGMFSCYVQARGMGRLSGERRKRVTLSYNRFNTTGKGQPAGGAPAVCQHRGPRALSRAPEDRAGGGGGVGGSEKTGAGKG